MGREIKFVINFCFVFIARVYVVQDAELFRMHQESIHQAWLNQYYTFNLLTVGLLSRIQKLTGGIRNTKSVRLPLVAIFL